MTRLSLLLLAPVVQAASTGNLVRDAKIQATTEADGHVELAETSEKTAAKWDPFADMPDFGSMDIGALMAWSRKQEQEAKAILGDLQVDFHAHHHQDHFNSVAEVTFHDHKIDYHIRFPTGGGCVGPDGSTWSGMPDGVPLRIQGVSGKNLQDSDQDWPTMADGEGTWEQWYLEWAGGDSFYIRSRDAHGRCLQDYEGHVRFSWNCGGWEKWTLHADGDKLSFKSHRGQYLQDNNGNMQLADNEGDWERFVINAVGVEPLSTVVQRQKIALKSHRNDYLQENGDSQLTASGNKGGWESWQFVIADIPLFSFDTLFTGYLQGHSGDYLQDNDGKLMMSKNKGGWEKWEVSMRFHWGKLQYFIKSHAGRYLQDNNGVMGLSWGQGDWEAFEIDLV